MKMPFFSWWRKPVRKPMQVCLFTRTGCHLCEDAGQLLQTEQKRFGFLIEVVDIDGDPDLVARYGTCVPVVAVNGQVRFRGKVNAVLLRRLLQAEGHASKEG